MQPTENPWTDPTLWGDGEPKPPAAPQPEQ